MEKVYIVGNDNEGNYVVTYNGIKIDKDEILEESKKIDKLIIDELKIKGKI